MGVAVTEFLSEMRLEGCPEQRSTHETLSGDYSEAALAFALRYHHNIFSLDLDNPVLGNPASLRRIFGPTVCGVLVNKVTDEDDHGVSMKVVNEQIWLPDSALSPRCVTYDEYVFFV